MILKQRDCVPQATVDRLLSGLQSGITWSKLIGATKGAKDSYVIHRERIMPFLAANPEISAKVKALREKNRILGIKKARAEISKSYIPPLACRRGHAFSAANTYFTPGGIRRCRECQRLSDLRNYPAKKEYRARSRVIMLPSVASGLHIPASLPEPMWTDGHRLFEVVRRATSSVRWCQDEIISDMLAAILEGSLREEDVPLRVRDFVRARNARERFSVQSRFGHVSLDAALFHDSERNRHSLISEDQRLWA